MDINKSATISGDLRVENNTVVVNLAVLFFEDHGVQVAYCPAINIYGYGTSETEAMQSFEICMEEFFKYTIHKKTLTKELQHLGWKVKKESRLHRFTPPVFSSLLDKNKTLHTILNTRNFQKVDKAIQIPIA